MVAGPGGTLAGRAVYQGLLKHSWYWFYAGGVITYTASSTPLALVVYC